MKKFSTVAITSILAVLMVSPTFASEISPTSVGLGESLDSGHAHLDIIQSENEKAFHEIRIKLSKEYGIEVRAATEKELEGTGLKKSVIKLTPEEFEEKTRESIKYVLAANRKAEAQAETIGIVANKQLADSSGELSAQAIITASKVLDGGNAEAVITGEFYTGLYAYWGQISSAVYYDYKSPFFRAQTWGYSLGTASRTAHVLFNGAYYDEQLNYLGPGSVVAVFNASDYD